MARIRMQTRRYDRGPTSRIETGKTSGRISVAENRDNDQSF